MKFLNIIIKGFGLKRVHKGIGLEFWSQIDLDLNPRSFIY